MPSINRPLSGDVTVLRLNDERAVTADPALLQRSGRSARTLIKDGPLRVTMMVIAPGGSVPTHRADGPITVLPVEGRLRFNTSAGEYDVGPGELLALGPGIEHSVESDEGATFLLTVAHPPRAGG